VVLAKWLAAKSDILACIRPGGLFKVRPGVRGLPAYKFGG